MNLIVGLYPQIFHLHNYDTKVRRMWQEKLSEKSDYLSERFKRYVEGVTPYLVLNTLDKWAGLVNPHW